MSSTISARCGSSSETSVPHWPCLANFHGLPNSFLLARVDEAEFHFARIIAAAEPRQLGLGIEQIDVRRAAVLKQRDHRRGARRKVRRLRLQVEVRRLFAQLARRGPGPLLRIQPGQCDGANPHGVLGQELAAGLRR